jgi:hypothetical protein
MRKYALLIALFTFPMIGCLPPLNDGSPGSGSDGGSTTTPKGDMAGPGGQGADQGGTPGTGVSGTITTDTTWSGQVNVSGAVTVGSGVTLTVSSGALISISAGADIHIQGSLVAAGTSTSPVLFQSVQQGTAWGSLLVESGGSIDLTYADIEYANVPISCATGAVKCTADHTKLEHFSGQGMMIAADATFTHMDVELGGSDGISFQGSAGQTVTITDSIFHSTGGDAIVSDGAGNLTFQYNHVYGNGGAAPGQHCACHFDSTGTFTVDHNLFEKSSVGFMASQMNAQSKVNYNNYENNQAIYSPASGNISASADLSHNYWGTPTPPTIPNNTSNQGADGSAYYSTPIVAPTQIGPRP